MNYKTVLLLRQINQWIS